MVEETFISNGYANDRYWIAGLTVGSIAYFSASQVSPRDKKHFGFSLALGAATEYMMRKTELATNGRWVRIAVASTIGLIPGIIKESTDFGFSTQDVLVNAVGSFSGALLSDFLQGPTQTQQLYRLELTSDSVQLRFSSIF